jgi:hypothetical protein
MFCKIRPLHPSLTPWLSAVTLWLLFELPAALHWDEFAPSAVRPTGEFLLLATAAWLGARANRGRAVLWATGLLAALLLVVRLDFAVYFMAMRSQPLLYEQLITVQHLFGLITDLFTPAIGLALLGFLVLAVAFVWLTRALIRRAGELAEPPAARRVKVVLSVLWCLALAGTLLGPSGPSRAWVRWMVPELIGNARESIVIHRSVQRGITDSPYRSFRSVGLAHKPDVIVFFVESYGRVLAEHQGTRQRWNATLSDFAARLSNSGWHTASAFSTATVSGGSSWLAVGSIFFGAHVRYQGVFDGFVEAGDSVPSLPRFFEQQGYTTVNLAPSVRRRPGVDVENRYGWDTYARQEDLEYRGPKMGWGVVPDQYALGFAEERLLPRVEGPLFFHFHMVSSHAIWDGVPEYVPDWRSWNSMGGELARRSQDAAAHAPHAPAERHLRGLTASLLSNYERSVLYDLRVVEDFLSRRTRDTLVIVMGDHQPPILSTEEDSFDVPIHLVARDPAVLQEFLEHGFTAGLVPPAELPAQVKHEGLFSLIVRALARAYGSSAVPEYLANGVRVGS